LEGSIPFQAGRALQIGQAGQSEQSATTTVRVPSGVGSLELPSGADFLRADFTREGFDLILDDGALGTVVVPDYFLRLSPPDLVTADGAVLPHHIVRALAGPMTPGQVAQIGIGPAAAATDVVAGAPIGSVSESQGAVTVLHPNGAEAMLVTGDPIFQGDVLTTGPDGAVSVIFVDDTVFSLDVDGRMVMDEMVYDPGTQTGTFNAMVVQGVFSFVSGQVAKTSPDGMVVNTPTATIGIRGSTVVGNAAAEGAENKISLVRDVDGNIGEIMISNGAGTLVLNQAGASTTVFSASAAPGPMVVLSAQEIQQSYGGSLTRLVKTVAKQADQKAAQAQDKAANAEADAQAAKEEADAAQEEADAAQAQADADAAEAEAELAAAEEAGDEQAIAEAEAKVAAAAEAKAQAEAAAVAAEAAAQEAAAAEAEAQQAAVEAEQATAFSSMANTALTVQVNAEIAVQQDTATAEAEKAQTAGTVVNEGEPDPDGEDITDTPLPDPDPLPFPEPDPLPLDPLPLPGEDPFAEGLFDAPLLNYTLPPGVDFFDLPPDDVLPPPVFLEGDPANSAPTVNLSKLESGPFGFTSSGAATFDGLVATTFVAGASALSDLDNDGDLDIVMHGYDSTAGSATSSTYVGINDGSGNFTYSVAITNGLYMKRMDVGDVDGDGIADIVFAENSATAQPIYFGDGTGGFTQSSQIISTTGGTIGANNVALADFNGDGFNDMFVNIDAGIKVFLNAQGSDAPGAFTDTGQSLTSTKTAQSYRGLAVGDIDGDGDIDAVTGSWGEQMDVWRNDGAGTFTNAGRLSVLGTDNTTSGATNGVDMGDLDGDGDLDIFAFNRYVENKVFLNDGAGNFTETQAVGTTGARDAGSLVDIDGDGDLDAIMAQDGGVEVYLNDGNANFTAQNLNIGANWPVQVHGGDLNGDGGMDILVAHPSASSSDILTNTQSVPNAEVIRAGSFIFQDSTFGVTDADNPLASSLTFVVTSTPTNGTLLLGGATLSAYDTFTQADVLNGNVSYLNSGASSASDSFKFIVFDGQGGETPLQTFNLSIMNTPINGTAGVDTLGGAAGIDTITGGAAADTLSGGAGSDRFVYTSINDAPVAGNETITDFDATSATEDIVLNGLLNGAFSYLGAGTFSAGGNTEAIFNDTSKLLSIDINGNGAADLEITLTGVATADLDVTDFTVS